MTISYTVHTDHNDLPYVSSLPYLIGGHNYDATLI